MKWWEKIKSLFKKGLSLIGEFVTNAAAFSIALIKAPFTKEKETVPTSEELNKEYIEKIDKIISTNEKEESKNTSMEFNEKMLQNKIDNILSSLNDMELKENGMSYLYALKQIFKDCTIKVNEENNYVISFPRKEYDDNKKKNNGDLTIDKTLIIDKDGNFISGERDYYNVHTHYKKTIFLNELDFNEKQLALFKETCCKIEVLKSQYEQTYVAKLYAEDADRMYLENTLTKDTFKKALEEMGVDIDNYGNIMNIKDCNRFALNAADNLISIVRNKYEIDIEENIFDGIQCKNDAFEATKDITNIIKNLNEYYSENTLDPKIIKDVFSAYIGEGSVSCPEPDSTKINNEFNQKTIAMINKIVINAANEICEKYDIDKDSKFFEVFEDRYNGIEQNTEKEIRTKKSPVKSSKEDKEKDEVENEERDEKCSGVSADLDCI